MNSKELIFNLVFKGGDIYLNMAINVLIEIPSYLSCIFILDKFGRRSTVIVTQLGKELYCLFMM